MQLTKGSLACKPFGNNGQHETQHGKTAIEELGGAMKTPSPFWFDNLDRRLNRSGIEQFMLVRTPALIFRF
jgi:hypothetical protein